MSEADVRRVIASAEPYQPPFVSFGSTLPGRFREFKELPILATKAATLPSALLPARVRLFILDAAERMQLSPEHLAAPFLVAVAAVLGTRVSIQPKAHDDAWMVTPNLWGGVVAPPSAKKTAAINEATQFIRKLEVEAREAHDRQAPRLKAELVSISQELSCLERELRQAHKTPDQTKIKPLEHRLADTILRQEQAKIAAADPRLLVADATIEKLGELLLRNQRGLLLNRDELAGFVRGLERDDRRGDREFYLESWNGGGSYTWDRIGRGTVHLDRLCISIIGGIQPGKLRKLVSEAVDGGFAADGLLQRFQLIVWPEVSRDWTLVDRPPDRAAYREVQDLFARLDGVPEGTVLRFSDDAQALFNDWLGDLEGRLRAEAMDATPAFQAHLAKYRSLMPSIAAIMQFCEDTEATLITLDAARQAAGWCDFLESHARKVYSPELAGELARAHALAKKIRSGVILTGTPVREIYRHGWAGLREADHVELAIEVLAAHGWVLIDVVEPRGRGGRPSPVLRINPAVFGDERAS